MRSVSTKLIPHVQGPSTSGSRLVLSLIAAFSFPVSESIVASGQDEFQLPTPVEASQFDSLKSRSPFTRVLDLSETLQLTGLAVIEGEQVATIEDRRKGKRFTISGEANEEGWKMVSAESSEDLGKVSATISVYGDEVVTLTYAESQLRPEVQFSGRSQIKIPSGPDKRPLPTEKEKRDFGNWVRSRMGKMSEDQRKRVGQLMQEKMKNNPGLTDRQKGEVFVQILDFVDPQKK